MKVVAFGEIMMRLSPPGFLRFVQVTTFDVTFGGSEANVLALLARLGVETEYVTRLPDNELGELCLMCLRQHGIGTSHIVRGGARLGIYFVERGAVQRPSKVIYDRANSAIATIEKGMIDWEQALSGADWFHWTGITPAISEGLAEVCLEGVQKAREMGLTVSCDLNYRSKLWKWGRSPGEVMPAMVSLCDMVIGNEEDADRVFGIRAPDTDVTSGRVEAAKYRYVCEKLVERFPNVRTVGITLRGSLSASHNTWSGVLWHEGQMYTAPTYDITHIVDRVGAGDSFAAGLIYGLNRYEGDPQTALNFAVAASCLKHTIIGDFNTVSLAEIEKLMGGDVSGRVSR